MRTSDQMVYIRQDDGWLIVTLLVVLLVIGLAVGGFISYSNAQALSKDAQVCRLNGGQPVHNYYGELVCVAVQRP